MYGGRGVICVEGCLQGVMCVYVWGGVVCVRAVCMGAVYLLLHHIPILSII